MKKIMVAFLILVSPVPITTEDMAAHTVAGEYSAYTKAGAIFF